jgi:F0F1-type ATP synthase membrane subunit b/b'
VKRRQLIFAALAMGAMFVSAAGVRAQESQEVQPQDTTAGQIFRWLNFVLIFGGIGYAIAKFAPPVFKARAGAIAKDIESARAEKAQAEKQLREAETGLARLDQDTAAMRAQSEKDFAAEAQRLRESGKQEAEKIGRIAEIEIDATARAAQLELRALAARIAVERAAAMVRQQMTPERRATIFENFVQNLPA